MTEPIQYKDVHDRKFRSLRLSLTDRCNLACLYCVSDIEASGGVESGPTALAAGKMPMNNAFLSAQEFCERVLRIKEATGLYSVRLTGGEPTLYRDLVKLIGLLKENDIERVYLTTNGSRIANIIEDLQRAGLDGINISLDALDGNAYRLMGRRGDVNKVLHGIEKTVRLGVNTKLNCTVYGGANEDQILPLLEYAGSLGIRIRFLELMNMGHLYSGPGFEHSPLFVSQNRILEIIGQRYSISRMIRKPSAKANYWESEHGFSFGIIANHTEPFCSDCNRLRMDSRGRLYGCLSADRGLSFSLDDSVDKLAGTLQEAMNQKQAISFSGSSLSMKKVGG